MLEWEHRIFFSTTLKQTLRSMPQKNHGYSPEISNRKFRFDYFREKMINGASLDSFVYKDEIPQRFTNESSAQFASRRAAYGYRDRCDKGRAS